MQVTVTAIEGPTVNVTGRQEFAIALTATPAPVVNVAVAGVQGPPGPSVEAGPGFVKVGNEIRYAISTLSRA
jgi:hypothetical protein